VDYEAFIYQRGPYNNMADSSAGLTVRLPCDWLNVKHVREYLLQGRAIVKYHDTIQAVMSERPPIDLVYVAAELMKNLRER